MLFRAQGLARSTATPGGVSIYRHPTLGATRHQESAPDAGPGHAEGTFPFAQAGRRAWALHGSAAPPAPLGGSRRPAPARPQGCVLTCSSSLTRSMGATAVLETAAATPPARKSFRKLRAWSLMMTAGRTQPARSRALALAYARPGTASPSPTLRHANAEGPLARPAALLISPAQGLARAAAPGPARAVRIGWAGARTPGAVPRLAEGIGGEGASGRQGWAGGCTFSLGRLKGIFMLSARASGGNTVSLRHVGRCIYSTRGLSLGPTWGRTGTFLEQGWL